VIVSGDPIGARICRYSGLNGHPPVSLLGEGSVVHPLVVQRLQRVINASRAIPKGLHSCPADFGSRIVVRFRYPTSPTQLVSVDETGCRTVRSSTGVGMARPGLIAELKRLSNARRRVIID
jgi:hypothetical protein